MNKKPELLAPAGNMEKLKYALHYGADAVYCAGTRYGMRAGADNFSLDGLQEAADYTHNLGKKIYVTLNASLHTKDFEALPAYTHYLNDIGVDHVICADPGVFMTVRETAPSMKISVSTQANTLNLQSCRFWQQNGAGRIVLARELGLTDVKEIVAGVDKSLEIEMFVHGAMCISHSGRCLLSNYMTGRDANKGECAQPCRWNYSLQQENRYSLIEQKRPGQAFEIMDEPGQGSFIFNSKDLCLIDKLPELIDAGVSSFKIEGRMKSLYYAATVTNAYRRAIDDAIAGRTPGNYRAELEKTSHRAFTTAFYDRQADERDQNYGTSAYIRDYDYAGIVLEYDPSSGTSLVEQRNKITAGDEIEIMQPGADFITVPQAELYDEAGAPLESTPHAKMRFRMATPPTQPMDILRKRVG